MSVEIFARDFDLQPYDSCGNTTVATLKINGVIIHLCKNCLEELESEIKRFQSITFFYMCKNYVQNTNGSNYSGYCKKEAADRGIVVKDSDIGYVLCKDFWETCENAIRE